MSKILITDFFGTLVPGDIDITDFRYGNHKEIFEDNYQFDFSDTNKGEYALGRMVLVMSRVIAPFLEEGNRVVIVTSADSHDPVNLVYQKILGKMMRYLSSYSGKISLFFQSSGYSQDVLSNLKQVASIYSKDGVMYAQDENGFTFTLIDAKEQVFDYLSFNGEEVYAIGDDVFDFKMLSKCMELGGKASVINEFMLREIPIQDLIREVVMRLYRQEKEKIIYRIYPDCDDKMQYLDACNKFNNALEFEAERRRLQTFMNEKKKEYFRLLQAGSFDYFGELGKNILFDKIQMFNSIVAEQKKALRIDPQKWFQEVDVYPTFQVYYERVLKKKKF